MILAIAGDRLDRHGVIQFIRDGQAAAIGFDLLIHDIKPGAGIIDIVEDGRAGKCTRQQAVALARVRIVFHIIARQADEERAIVEFDRAAGPPDILVVVFDTFLNQIVAETAARQPGTADTHLQAIGHWCRCGDDQICLIIRSVGPTDFDRGLVGQGGRDVFDRAADRVAAVQSALRSA